MSSKIRQGIFNNIPQIRYPETDDVHSNLVYEALHMVELGEDLYRVCVISYNILAYHVYHNTNSMLIFLGY